MIPAMVPMQPTMVISPIVVMPQMYILPVQIVDPKQLQAWSGASNQVAKKGLWASTAAQGRPSIHTGVTTPSQASSGEHPQPASKTLQAEQTARSAASAAGSDPAADEPKTAEVTKKRSRRGMGQGGRNHTDRQKKLRSAALQPGRVLAPSSRSGERLQCTKKN
eukprot:TRINITY_DN1283_c0_g1_i3.p2 TRINITY_DN1283_c0_g1~~TRINITY_DN1283_c0_g1_i3.p2  ORF type:complete len:183 (+),score=32.88 TRINITY_DN1283_c0_g1_i3:58-549(+)